MFGILKGLLQESALYWKKSADGSYSLVPFAEAAKGVPGSFDPEFPRLQLCSQEVELTWSEGSACEVVQREMLQFPPCVMPSNTASEIACGLEDKSSPHVSAATK